MYWSKMTYYVAENRCSCGLAAENNIKMLPRTHAMARRSLTWHCLKMGSGGLFYLLTLNLEPRTCIWQTHRLSIVKNRGHFLSCLLKRFLTFFKFDFLFKGSGYSSRSRSGRDKYGPPVRTEYRLIVENLSSRCSWQDLKVHVCSWIIRLLYSFYPQLFLENYVMVFFFVFFFNFLCPSGLHAPGRRSDVCWRPQGTHKWRGDWVSVLLGHEEGSGQAWWNRHQWAQDPSGGGPAS